MGFLTLATRLRVESPYVIVRGELGPADELVVEC